MTIPSPFLPMFLHMCTLILLRQSRVPTNSVLWCVILVTNRLPAG